MTPCVYCIGCRYYDRDSATYCTHPDGERCNHSELREEEEDGCE